MNIPSPFTIYDDDLELVRRFTAFMELVVIHARVDFLRKQDRNKHEVPLDELLLEEELYYDNTFQRNGNEFDFEEEKLEKAFERLPLLRKNLLTLIFVEGLSVQEVADRLNCPVEYVYQKKHRTLNALRDQLMDEEGGKCGK